MTALEKKLLNIAKKDIFLFREGERSDLETHRNDEEDFLEIAIWDLKKALEDAYYLGREEERKAK